MKEKGRKRGGGGGGGSVCGEWSGPQEGKGNGNVGNFFFIFFFI